MSNAVTAVPKSLGPAALEAQREWARAGIENRLAVLSEAGDRLAAHRAKLNSGLKADGLSDGLADFYGEWIVHQGRPDVLARYARDLVRWEDTPHGTELMVRRPDGVVLLITPANSPTINAAALFSILLPGNAVIIRAPGNDEGLRFVAEDILRSTLVRHGFSEALVQVVTGRSREVLAAHLAAPEVRTVVFFGNSVAGRSVAEQCHAHGKKAVLELDGSDHMVVWRDADLAGAISSAEHAFDFSTQPCPIPKHLLVHDAVYEPFMAGLLARLPKMSRTVEADPVNGNLVPVARPDAFEAAFEELRSVGELRCGGYRMNAEGERDPAGLYVAPTVIAVDADVCLSRPLKAFDEEIFFPLIPVVRFDGSDSKVAEQMAELMGRSAFGLRASVWSANPEMMAFFAREVDSVGLLLFNEDHAQCPYYASPWGGPKRSGGPHGESHLFWEKTSHLQAISLKQSSGEQIEQIVSALGYAEIARDSGKLTAKTNVTIPAASGKASRGVGADEELFDGVRVVIDGHIGQLILHRPDRHNAVDNVMKQALEAATNRLSELCPQIRCVVVRGTGRSFCSGADLGALVTFDPDEARRFMVEATWAFRKLSRLDVPVIAAVQGYCLGGGFELALHCDYIIARDDAVMGFPEAALGLVTTTGSVERLVGVVGANRARELLLTGRRIGAKEAKELGLVAEVAPPESFESVVSRRADSFAAQPREGLAAMKALIARSADRDESASWIAEIETFETLVRERQRK